MRDIIIIAVIVAVMALIVIPMAAYHNMQQDAEIAKAQAESDKNRAMWYAECQKQFSHRQCQIIAGIKDLTELEK